MGITIDAGVAKYSWTKNELFERLKLRSSFDSKRGGEDGVAGVISDNDAPFVEDSLSSALRILASVHDENYVPLSLNTDDNGVCCFSASADDRALLDLPQEREVFYAAMGDFLVGYAYSDWRGKFSGLEAEIAKLRSTATRLFAYKYSESFAVEEVPEGSL